MSSISRVLVFDTPGEHTWIRDRRLYAIDLIVVGGGGSGSSGMSHATAAQRRPGSGGGGGGVNITERRIGVGRIGDSELVVVGAGGAATGPPAPVDGAWIPGNDGGRSAFGGLLSAEGGRGGGWTYGALDARIGARGDGGYAVMRGGAGASYTGTAGVDTTSGIVRLLAGAAGGGRGAGFDAAGSAAAQTPGGISSSNPVTGSWRSAFALMLRAGNGGAGGTTSVDAAAGEAPGGGGGDRKSVV